MFPFPTLAISQLWKEPKQLNCPYYSCNSHHRTSKLWRAHSTYFHVWNFTALPAGAYVTVDATRGSTHGSLARDLARSRCLKASSRPPNSVISFLLHRPTTFHHNQKNFLQHTRQPPSTRQRRSP